MGGAAFAGFSPAPNEILSVVGRLIATHFPHLGGVRILVLARDHALEAEGGQFSVAATGVPSDESQASHFDYVLWFAWDVWQVLDDGDKDALTFHELMHCGRDEQTGKPALKPHDASVFDKEVELYGLWWVDAQKKFEALNRSVIGERNV